MSEFNFDNGGFKRPFTPRNKRVYYSSIIPPPPRPEGEAVECIPCAGADFPEVTFTPSQNIVQIGGGSSHPSDLPDVPFVPPILDHWVSRVALFPDRTIAALGQFRLCGSTVVNRLCFFNLDGSLRNGFPGGLGFPNFTGGTDLFQFVESGLAVSESKVFSFFGSRAYTGQTPSAMPVMLDFNSNFLAIMNEIGGPNREVISTPYGVFVWGIILDSFGNRFYISKLNQSTGQRDPSFNPALTGPGTLLWSVCVLSDGSVLYAYDGTMKLLNSSGSVDGSFATGTITDSAGTTTETPVKLFQCNSGLIIASGDIGKYNGTSVSNIVALNRDGTINSAMTNNLAATFNFSEAHSPTDFLITKFQSQSDGKIVVSGQFLTLGGISYPHIGRLNVDGTVDSSFNAGTGFDDDVYDMVVDSKDYIVCGGNFLNYNGVSRPYLCKLGKDGKIN